MKRLFSTIFVVLTTISIFVACDPSDPWSPFESKATLSRNSFGWDEQTVTIKTSGDTRVSWDAAIVDGYDWASFSNSNEQITKSGIVGATATVYLSNNTTSETRSASILVKFSDGYKTMLTFEQFGVPENSFYDRSWAEQPEFIDNDDLIHKTYYTTLANGDYVRNYSICYDTDKLVSRWVAYPLHSCYINPSLSRTNAWSFDPALPESIQQNIVSGGYNDGGNRQLDRGHMLPSASRYSTYDTNAQTFYATNMMPQNSSFNQSVWGQLEGQVRKAICADTLYVVVGTLFEDGQKFTSRGRTIARPSHCYKLLLRTKSGNTQKSISQITDPSEIKAIGFIFENQSSAGSIESAATSIAEIEKRAGITFFRNLNPDIAAEVKKQNNIKDWNF